MFGLFVLSQITLTSKSTEYIHISLNYVWIVCEWSDISDD